MLTGLPLPLRPASPPPFDFSNHNTNCQSHQSASHNTHSGAHFRILQTEPSSSHALRTTHAPTPTTAPSAAARKNPCQKSVITFLLSYTSPTPAGTFREPHRKRPSSQGVSATPDGYQPLGTLHRKKYLSIDHRAKILLQQIFLSIEQSSCFSPPILYQIPLSSPMCKMCKKYVTLL